MTESILLTDEFSEALARLETGQNLFLTGKAGTGKSTLIREFMSRTLRNVVVAAPTGIAALNVDGYTIHRLFGLHPRVTLEEVRGGRYYPGRFAATLKALDTLIIDEASMVRADLFDQLALALERFGPSPGEPFGGVQLVLVGDLLQLPPVVTDGERAHFETRYETPYFFSADSYAEERFPTVSLTTVFRQQGDDQLTAVLNSIREGVLLGSAREDLNQQVDPDFESPEDEFWLTLATTNRIAEARNRRRLERLPGEEHTSHAVIRGDQDGFESPSAQRLVFGVGAQIMMLTNDPSGRWVNGTLGHVVEVGVDREGQAQVRVGLREGGVVDVGPHTWEITRPEVDGGQLSHTVVGTFTQLPFKLAWAITIHKSQGQTADRLVVDLSGGTFAFGQLYVALSRVTSLAGLVLTRPVLPRDMKTDRRILRFLRGTQRADAARRHCALAVLTVGDEGRMSRPRPVEIALCFDDGTGLSTLVNPQRDLADARTRFGIATPDVLMAPTLAEAWALLAPALQGCTPVGEEIDLTLGLLDFEFKRLGVVVPLPFGTEAPPVESRAAAAPRALARARAVMEAFHAAEAAGRSATDRSATEFEDSEDTVTGVGHLLTRDPEMPGPSFRERPGLGAILEVSRTVGGVVLGLQEGAPGRSRSSAKGAMVADTADVGDSWHNAARQTVAEQLAVAAGRVQLPAELALRLHQLGEWLGREVVSEEQLAAGDVDGIEDVLSPGTKICFTGEAVSPDGRCWSREQMTELAASHGLRAVPTVTKTRCDVLVVAELGTQSGKARKAQEYGKPVLSAEDFFAWAGLN